MKTIYIVLSLFLFINLSVNAQKSYKIMSNNVFEGMDARAQSDIDDKFDDAREKFLKVLAKYPDDVMSHFGLSVVYSFDKYTGKDYFEAWTYFKIADKNISQVSEDDKPILNEYFFKVDKRRRNRPLNKNMDWERANVEDKLIKYVREENKLEYANKFLDEFPKSRYYGNVVHIRNYIEFRTAENTNTVQAFNSFLKKYPDAAQVKIAKEKKDVIAYNDALSKNSLSALKAFVKLNPDALQVEDAKKLMGVFAYNEAANTRNLQIIEQFMVEYPNSSKMPEAKVLKKQLLFEWAKNVNTIDAYNQFVSLYPEGELYIDIFNLKATALGQELLMDFPRENYIFIKGFDNQNMNDFGGNVVVRQSGEILVIGNTKISKDDMYDAWLLGLNSEGKMLWNRILGNKFDDNVNNIVITPKNEIYVGGITNAIIDSVPGQSWLFKMGADGNNIYNRKLDGRDVVGLAVYPDGKVLVCGSTINKKNSLLEPYLIRVNEDGKKLWSRTYSQGGKIYNVALDKNNIGYVANETWYFAIDEMGYLKWDKIVDAEIKITAVKVLGSGNIVFAGTKGQQGYVIACNADGTQVWESEFDAKSLSEIQSITLLANNSVLCAGTSADDKIIIVKIDEFGKASSPKVFNLPGGIVLNGIAPSGGSTVIVSATRLSPKKDILVFKLSF